MKRSKKSMRMNVLHFKVLTVRYFRQIVTSVPTVLSLLFQAPVMLCIVALVYQKGAFLAPRREALGYVSPDASNANMTLFVLVFMAALMGILNSYREICKEREVLGREVYGGLDVTSYAASKLTVLATVGMIQSILMAGGSLLFIDFNMANPILDIPVYIVALFLTNVSVASLGLLISALLKKSESAILPVLLVIIMQVVFSDCVIPLSGAATWFYWITPTRWGTAILGKQLRMNEIYYQKASYDYNVLFSMLALAAVVAVCYALTVWKLKRTYRTKD